ncbi:MAG: S-layer protein domain-containing protein, partial [Candidatus Methanoperedens sp.]|nr:S-layer protein domain-containing protein [Candidatus Methanoperedens sp.]
GKTIDTKVVNEGEVYTYVEKSVSGESDVPVFVTYVESIFKGGEGMSALVQLRYTWLISQNVLEIRAGDKFGVFEVKEAKDGYVLLHNKEKSINLDQNTVQPLYGELKFKVADSSTALRFYPLFEQTILPPKVEVKTTPQVTTPQPTATPAVTAGSAVVSEPVRASAPEAIQATPAEVKTTGSAALSKTTGSPAQWNWILFAIAGIGAIGYIIVRRYN